MKLPRLIVLTSADNQNGQCVCERHREAGEDKGETQKNCEKTQKTCATTTLLENKSCLKR